MMFVANFLLLTLLWTKTYAYNYLVISTNFVYSHTVFNAKIAEVLQDRGHHVNFILFRTNNLTQFHPGALQNVTVITPDSIDLMSETASKMKLFNDVFSDDEPLFGDDQVRPVFETMKVYCRDLLSNEQVKKIAEEVKYDAVFTESHDVCAQAIGHIFNIKPLFLMSPVPIPEHSASEMGVPVNPNVVPVLNRAPANGVYMTLFERIQNWREYYDSVISMSKWFANPEVYELTHLQLPHPAEFTKNAAFYIQNTNEFVDLPRPISLKQLFVGGFGIPKAKALSEEIQQIYSSAKKGVVYLSFGSLADNKKLPQNVRKAFAAAFSQFPDYQFIWKFNDKLNESNIDNVHTLPWVDQVSILNHPKTKAFITHCGLNSLNEAAFAGVPLISVPLFGDQTYNTAVVRHIGTGVNLHKLKLNSKVIVNALNSVLNEGKYAKTARELSELLNNLPQSPNERLINGVEQATKFPEAYEKLILPGAKVSFWVYFGLDIVGLLLSSIVFSCLVVYLLCRVMVRIYLRVEKKNRKKVE